MTKTSALRRFFLPCFSPTATTSSTTAAAVKKRLSTSLRDDIITTLPGSDPPSPDPVAPPRPSRTMVTGTIFGRRRGPHVWFCVQPDRVSTRPALLLQIPLPTQLLVKEMRCGLVRIALESETRPGSDPCPLRSVPTWAASCNGRKLGFAARKKPTESTRSMLASLRSTTVGAGVIPAGSDAGAGSGSGSGDGEGELMYMRASYEWMVGGPDCESFHLVSPDQCPGQELSIFLLRSR